MVLTDVALLDSFSAETEDVLGLFDCGGTCSGSTCSYSCEQTCERTCSATG